MAVCLSGLTGPMAFDTVCEPATILQCWQIWNNKFELFVRIFRTIPEQTKGGDKDYKKAMEWPYQLLF